MQSFFSFTKKIFILCAALLLFTGCKNIGMPNIMDNPWELINLPSQANLIDITFSTPEHGWVVGSEATILETNDGGNTWQPYTIELGEEKARFTGVSFAGKEGWIVGQPPIMLHTTDDGKTWSRLPLSAKLPGSPNTIIALGPNSAEMTTNVGAIYRTEDGGKNWKAQVEDAVGVIRNISRSSDGKYITVSAKGNFYSTWEPGQKVWQPFNRNSSRRLEKIGFAPDNQQLWMIARGGQLQFTDPANPQEWLEPIKPESTVSWGLLDLAYRTPDELWVSGGSGNLLRSVDGGKTWQKDKEVEDVAANFYRVIFFNPEQGFILGQNGTLLKYNSGKEIQAT